MTKLLCTILRYFAFEKGKLTSLYLKVCNPSNSEYVSLLKHRNFFYSIGDGCHINRGANFTDPKLVRIGNNVIFSDCTILGHDGVAAMLNVAYNTKLDSVGRVDIRDNVFIGHGAIVMPGITINSNTVVAAGSVVTKDVLSGDIVGGVPAKCIGKVDDLVKKLQIKTDAYPWADIIKAREGAFDPELEPFLSRMRQEYFFNPPIQ
jgi:acetyltransferase-like isoleucine patch superfamily enzyme